jgi:hypothetical protein
VGEEVGADHPAQRHERHALDAGEQAGVNRGTGRVHHPQAAVTDGLRESRRGAVLAERDRRGLDRRDAARADQHVGLDAARRQADEVQPLRAAPHERARRRNRDAVRPWAPPAGAVGDVRPAHRGTEVTAGLTSRASSEQDLHAPSRR